MTGWLCDVIHQRRRLSERVIENPRDVAVCRRCVVHPTSGNVRRRDVHRWFGTSVCATVRYARSCRVPSGRNRRIFPDAVRYAR